ncbi:MAG TPA: hypothetical protein VLH83_07430, partial [Chthoniobacterales bacterium]|nr:hypothetical protein [Chthoniobacterales bacterium]
MKRFFPWLVLLFAAAWVAASWFPPKAERDQPDLVAFGKIPVLVGGRIKPLDTVARNSLLIVHGKQTLPLANGEELTAIRWLADLLFRPEAADDYPVFVIQNSEVLGLFGWEQSDRKYFSLTELTPFLKQIDEQGEQADKLESVERSAYQSAILNLRNALILSQRLKNSLRPEDAHDFSKELQAYVAAIPPAAQAARQREKGETFDKSKLDSVAAFIERYENLSSTAYLLAIPSTNGAQWLSIGESLVQTVRTGEIHPVVQAYARLGDAYHSGDQQTFNQQVVALR